MNECHTAVISFYKDGRLWTEPRLSGAAALCRSGMTGCCSVSTRSRAGPGRVGRADRVGKFHWPSPRPRTHRRGTGTAAAGGDQPTSQPLPGRAPNLVKVVPIRRRPVTEAQRSRAERSGTGRYRSELPAQFRSAHLFVLVALSFHCEVQGAEQSPKITPQTVPASWIHRSKTGSSVSEPTGSMIGWILAGYGVPRPAGYGSRRIGRPLATIRVTSLLIGPVSLTLIVGNI